MKETSSKIAVLFLCPLLIFSNCDKAAQQRYINEKTNGDLETNEIDAGLTTIRIAGRSLRVEVVQDVQTRALGLMHREKLPENQGMLFVFEELQVLRFWMRNTFIPLDIAFINENGKIVDIQRMEPLDETKQYISREPGLYALEVNAGWFEKNAIKVGSNVSF